MNTAKDHADFLSAVVTGMSRLIPADLCAIHLLDRKTQRIVMRAIPENPYSQEEIAFYSANPSGDPLVAHFEGTGDPAGLPRGVERSAARLGSGASARRSRDSLRCTG